MDFKSAANKKTIEAFIYSGTLDCFGKSRHQHTGVYMSALEAAANKAKDREKGFGSIEDFLTGEREEFYPDVEELPAKEMLSREKEILGFYYSSHPLKEYNRYIETFAEDMELVNSMRSEGEVLVAGMIKSIRHHITKSKKEKMAFLELEDTKNSVDVVVFPKIYTDNIMHLNEDNIIAVKGLFTPNNEDGTGSITARKIMTLGHALEENTATLKITINTEKSTPDRVFQIKTLLARFKGRLPVNIAFILPNKCRVLMSVSEEYEVCPEIEFLELLKQVPGVIDIEFVQTGALGLDAENYITDTWSIA